MHPLLIPDHFLSYESTILCSLMVRWAWCDSYSFLIPIESKSCLRKNTLKLFQGNNTAVEAWLNLGCRNGTTYLWYKKKLSWWLYAHQHVKYDGNFKKWIWAIARTIFVGWWQSEVDHLLNLILVYDGLHWRTCYNAVYVMRVTST